MKFRCCCCNKNGVEYKHNEKMYCDECLFKVLGVTETEVVVKYFYASDGRFLGTDESFEDVIYELGVECL